MEMHPYSVEKFTDLNKILYQEVNGIKLGYVGFINPYNK